MVLYEYVVIVKKITNKKYNQNKYIHYTRSEYFHSNISTKCSWGFIYEWHHQIVPAIVPGARSIMTLRSEESTSSSAGHLYWVLTMTLKQFSRSLSSRSRRTRSQTSQLKPATHMSLSHWISVRYRVPKYILRYLRGIYDLVNFYYKREPRNTFYQYLELESDFVSRFCYHCNYKVHNT